MTEKKETLEDVVVEFKLDEEHAKKARDAILTERDSPSIRPEAVTVEERSYGVSDGARSSFAQLYEEQIAELGVCPLKRIGESEKSKVRCGAKLRSFQHFLVHHQMHIMLMGDIRTQRQANTDAREIVYPSSEKTQRVALGPEDRRRMEKSAKHRELLEQKRRERLLDS